MIKKTIYLNELYDYYGKLLTDKQRLYYEEYYFDNLSLAEISERHKVSRNAVFTQLQKTEEKLEEYEEKLSLNKKGKEIKLLISKLNDKLKEDINNLI